MYIVAPCTLFTSSYLLRGTEKGDFIEFKRKGFCGGRQFSSTYSSFDGSLDEVAVDLELLEKQKQSTLLIQKVNTSLSAYNSSAIGTWEILLGWLRKVCVFGFFVCVLRNLYLIKITKIFFSLCFLLQVVYFWVSHFELIPVYNMKYGLRLFIYLFIYLI